MAKAGQRISEYVLEDRLGAGAFGEVWKARHHAWHDKVVAVKLPHDGQVVRQLQREGLAVQGLDHPNVVKALGFDGHADPPYLVSEYVDGESLRGPIARKALDVPQAVAVVRQVLAGLGYAHSRGVVHRDVKPENVLLTKDGVAKLTDFGLGQTSVATANSVVFTMSLEGDRAAAIAGTLDYMSPEQRSGQPTDGRTDLYAVAVVLFELLTGDRPAGHETPGDLNPAVPPYLNDVFRRGYARLDRRYASAAEFAAALASPTPTPAVTPPQLPLKIPPLNTPPNPSRAAPVVPPPPRADARCPQCRRGVQGDDQFCMHCGVQLQPVVRRCDACGAFPAPDDVFCQRCGDGLGRMKLAVDKRA